MVGLERAILPLIAEREFGLVSKSVILSFIVGFGFVKAFTNLAAGRFSDRIGRKGLLVGGWIVGLPVPLILMWAPSWGWVTVANLLLGINQGLCWSTTVIMKIDLVVSSFFPWMTGAVLLGIGTAMVYPTLLAAIGDVAHPSWRASAVGVYRLWRDAGYAFGALLSGIIADLLGVVWAIAAVGVLTLASGLVVALRMTETLKRG
jgi:MFS family permease